MLSWRSCLPTVGGLPWSSGMACTRSPHVTCRRTLPAGGAAVWRHRLPVAAALVQARQEAADRAGALRRTPPWAHPSHGSSAACRRSTRFARSGSPSRWSRRSRRRSALPRRRYLSGEWPQRSRTLKRCAHLLPAQAHRRTREARRRHHGRQLRLFRLPGACRREGRAGAPTSRKPSAVKRRAHRSAPCRRRRAPQPSRSTASAPAGRAASPARSVRSTACVSFSLLTFIVLH